MPRNPCTRFSSSSYTQMETLCQKVCDGIPLAQVILEWIDKFVIMYGEIQSLHMWPKQLVSMLTTESDKLASLSLLGPWALGPIFCTNSLSWSTCSSAC